MAAVDHPIHAALARRLDLQGALSLCDLGCGIGGTLLAALEVSPSLEVAGIDRMEPAIAEARKHLAGRNADLRVGDLAEPLPWPDDSFDRIVCHNVLECLVEPRSLIEEAARVLTPEGVAVWSHADYEGLMVAADDHPASRNIVSAWAWTQQAWMDSVNPCIGRELPAMLDGTAFDLTAIEIHNTIATRFEEAKHHVVAIDQVLRSANPPPVPLATLDAWRADLDRRSESGRFFFAEPTVIVTTRLGWQ